MTPQSKFFVVGLFFFAMTIVWSNSHLAGIFMLVIGLSIVRSLDGGGGRR